MNNNGRIYPYPGLNDFNNTLAIHHDENHTHARINPNFVKTVINKGQARSIRKQTGCNFVITGDVLYYWLHWANISKYEPHYVDKKDKSVMAIVRDKKVIWYSIPGKPDGLAERKVLTEKFKAIKRMTLKDVLQSFNTTNR